MKFKVGQEVYIIPNNIPGLEAPVEDYYSNRIGTIAQIRNNPDPPRRYPYWIDNSSNKGFGFHESDLSRIYIYEGKRYVRSRHEK